MVQKLDESPGIHHLATKHHTGDVFADFNLEVSKQLEIVAIDKRNKLFDEDSIEDRKMEIRKMMTEGRSPKHHDVIDFDVHLWYENAIKDLGLVSYLCGSTVWIIEVDGMKFAVIEYAAAAPGLSRNLGRRMLVDVKGYYRRTKGILIQALGTGAVRGYWAIQEGFFDFWSTVTPMLLYNVNSTQMLKIAKAAESEYYYTGLMIHVNSRHDDYTIHMAANRVPDPKKAADTLIGALVSQDAHVTQGDSFFYRQERPEQYPNLHSLKRMDDDLSGVWQFPKLGKVSMSAAWGLFAGGVVLVVGLKDAKRTQIQCTYMCRIVFHNIRKKDTHIELRADYGHLTIVNGPKELIGKTCLLISSTSETNTNAPTVGTPHQSQQWNEEEKKKRKNPTDGGGKKKKPCLADRRQQTSNPKQSQRRPRKRRRSWDDSKTRPQKKKKGGSS